MCVSGCREIGRRQTIGTRQDIRCDAKWFQAAQIGPDMFRGRSGRSGVGWWAYLELHGSLQGFHGLHRILLILVLHEATPLGRVLLSLRKQVDFFDLRAMSEQ